MRPNRALWILIGSVSALVATALFWSPAQALFHFGQLHGDDLAKCAVAGFASLLILEMIKSQWFRGDKMFHG